jgi:aminoglycoside 3-N-acetyltransferase
MPPVSVSRQDILDALHAVGVGPGDILYVTAFLAMLGNSHGIAEDTIDALLNAVGPEGTVVMPAFNFDFCRKGAFDLATSPASTGILCEIFRQRHDAVRTAHPPFHSVAAVGKHAATIAALRASSSFCKESVFHWLFQQRAKYVLLGCGYKESVVHFHWLEEQFEVPYRYWKQFRGEIRGGGKIEQGPYYMYVRHLDADVVLKDNAGVDRLCSDFETAGLVRQTSLGYGKVRCFDLTDFYDFFAPKIAQDRLLLIKESARRAYLPADSPVLRVHHIAIVSRYAAKAERFIRDIGYQLAVEGIVPEYGVNTRLYQGFNVMIEFVDPIADRSVVGTHLARPAHSPIHHIAFEVEDFDRARDFFAQRGYFPIDGVVHRGPEKDQYVYFLSPVHFAGAPVELVFQAAVPPVGLAPEVSR